MKCKCTQTILLKQIGIKKLKLQVILTVDYDDQPQWQRISVHISGMNASKFKGQHLSFKKLLWTKYNFKTATLYFAHFLKIKDNNNIQISKSVKCFYVFISLNWSVPIGNVMYSSPSLIAH